MSAPATTEKTNAETVPNGAVADPAKAKEHKKGCIQVSSFSRKFVFIDLAKHMLASGEPFVEISALGAAISDCVSVVEVLKNQGMVEVTKIETCRGVEGAKRANSDKIIIHVVKTKEFDAKYAEQQAIREAKKNQDEVSSTQL